MTSIKWKVNKKLPNKRAHKLLNNAEHRPIFKKVRTLFNNGPGYLSARMNDVFKEKYAIEEQNEENWVTFQGKYLENDLEFFIQKEAHKE